MTLPRKMYSSIGASKVSSKALSFSVHLKLYLPRLIQFRIVEPQHRVLLTPQFSIYLELWTWILSPFCIGYLLVFFFSLILWCLRCTCRNSPVSVAVDIVAQLKKSPFTRSFSLRSCVTRNSLVLGSANFNSFSFSLMSCTSPNFKCYHGWLWYQVEER